MIYIDRPHFQAWLSSCLFRSELKKKIIFMAIPGHSWMDEKQNVQNTLLD